VLLRPGRDPFKLALIVESVLPFGSHPTPFKCTDEACLGEFVMEVDWEGEVDRTVVGVVEEEGVLGRVNTSGDLSLT